MHDLSHVAGVGHGVGLVYIIVLLEQFLELFIGALLISSKAENLKCLVLCHKSAFDP